MEDQTKGEIKHMRGSGPPILTIEGNAVFISQILFVVNASHGGPYSPGRLPMTAEVIGIDLTRRTVRLQVIGGRELLYAATSDSNSGNYWIFESADGARRNSVHMAEQSVKAAEKSADEAIDRLERCKAAVKSAEEWVPRQFEDDPDVGD